MATENLDYRRLFESAPGLLLILRPDAGFTIADATDASIAATKTRRETIVGRGLFEVFPDNPDDPAADGTANLRASLERAISSKAMDPMPVQKYEIRRPASEGGGFETRYWSPTNTPLLNAQGEVIFIIHRVEDVTKQRQARIEQDPFFQVSIDMLCISSYDGHFKKVNPAFEAVLGHTAEEFCSNSYMHFIHPDDIARTAEVVIAQLETKAQVLNFENRYRCKDGSYRLLSWKSAPVGDLMYACARDVTESRKHEEDLKNAKDSLELMNRDLKSFSYSVAHDLRAPLRSMIGFSNIVLEDEASQLSTDARQCLEKVAKAGQKMGQLIDGLLNLSQLARKQVVPVAVNLSSLAREVTGELQAIHPERKVNLKIEDDIVAHGDIQLIRLVLMNLLGNAWKYSAKLKDTAVIEFGCRDRDGQKMYFVKDNGAGFEMKFANKLFGVFQRLHSNSEFEGIGIGLATVQRIVEAHGGQVWATGEVDRGAEFGFSLPV